MYHGGVVTNIIKVQCTVSEWRLVYFFLTQGTAFALPICSLQLPLVAIMLGLAYRSVDKTTTCLLEAHMVSQKPEWDLVPECTLSEETRLNKQHVSAQPSTPSERNKLVLMWEERKYIDHMTRTCTVTNRPRLCSVSFCFHLQDLVHFDTGT